MSDPKSPFLECPAGGSIGSSLAHRHLLSKKCFIDFVGFFFFPDLRLAFHPELHPQALTEFHAFGGEELDLEVNVSWRISCPLIP